MKRILWVAVLLNFNTVFAQHFLDSINTIVKEKSLARAEKSCFKEFWSADKIDNGKECFEKYITSSYKFTLDKDTIEDELRIVTSKYEVSGSNDSGRVYFYLGKSKGLWLIEGINSDGHHYDLYLDKKVKAYFHVKQLPKHSDLTKLGNNIVKSTKTGMFELETPLLDTSGIHDEVYTELRKLKSLQLVSTHFSEQENKGVIVLEHITPQGTKEVNLYLKKMEGDDRLWRLYDQNHLTPHLNLFFK